MYIAIYYYSITGTTEEFASRIANALIKEKHHVEIVKIRTSVEVTGPGQKFKIINEPDFSKFDIVLWGGPVWAFSACPVIIECIKKSKGLSDKKVIPFVTMGLPFKSFGGNRAINQISKTTMDMGAKVLFATIIPKLFHNFKKLMDEEVIKIASMIKNH